MFANYRVGVIPSKAKVKFENVEEKRHPDYALLGDVLEDIKKRTSGLIAERKQLTEENARLTGRIQALEMQLAQCQDAKAERCPFFRSHPYPQPCPLLQSRSR